MKKTCKLTGKEFEITDKDLEFYKKMGVPVPTLCPEERQRRRQSFINLNNLYSREDGSGTKKIISPFSSDKNLNVIPFDIWFSDKIDARDFGVGIDFKKSIFEQFKDLQKVAPRWDRVMYNSENSDWSLNVANSKNTYLTTGCNGVEDTYYSDHIFYSTNVCDCEHSSDIQYGYELIETKKSNKVLWCYLSENISDSLFLFNCKGCQNCIACENLNNKKYYIFNKKVSKLEFEKIKSDILKNRNILKIMKEKYFLIIKNNLDKNFIINSQNCSGDKIYNSKNAEKCYLADNFEDTKFCERGSGAKNCYDILRPTENENSYEIASSYKIYNSMFCFNSVELTNCIYCETSWNLKNCFLCVGLKNAEFCILNKQYSKLKYFELKEKIIKHMKKTGEWGEFFPMQNSPYCYNETQAQNNFPLTKEEIINFGLKFKKIEKQAIYIGKKTIIPKNILETKDSILKEILECKKCKKNYRIVKAELNFYRKILISIPEFCPTCRHKERLGIMGGMIFK